MKCPVCSVESSRVLTEKLRRGTGKVFYCVDCEMGFLEDPKSADYYHDGYRKEVSHRSHGSSTNPREIFDTYAPHQAERLKLVPKCDSLLEIGASAGQFIWRANAYQRVAMEPDRACAEFMRKLGLSVVPEIPKDNAFDVVCAFQVMEHTEDPVQFLKAVRGAMKDEGKAYIEVPNLDDPLLSVWGVREYEPFYYHAQHSFYFSEHAVSGIAERAGLQVEACHYTQDYNILNHLHWIMNKGPQPTCDIGLAEPRVGGKNLEISAWLSDKLMTLNSDYTKKLSDLKCTSNMMLVLKTLTT